MAVIQLTVAIEEPSREAPEFAALTSSLPCQGCKILEEADHRIANHLASLAGYVRLKAADLFDQDTGLDRTATHLLLDGIGAQIQAIAQLHRSLSVNSTLSETDLNAHLHELCAPLTLGFYAIDLVEDFGPGCVVAPGEVLALSQIVSEVITNAVKYAEPVGKRGAVLVRSRRNPEGGVQIEVIDNGPGLPEAFDPQSDGGLGLRLVRGLARQIGARVAFESSPLGLRFSLTLQPLQA